MKERTFTEYICEICGRKENTKDFTNAQDLIEKCESVGSPHFNFEIGEEVKLYNVERFKNEKGTHTILSRYVSYFLHKPMYIVRSTDVSKKSNSEIRVEEEWLIKNNANISSIP